MPAGLGARATACSPRARSAALVRLDAAEEGALREALGTFTELGASAVARLTRQRLRALGARPRPPSSACSRERCVQRHGRCRSDLCDETGEIGVTIRRA
jgi:hypothetical protein